LMPPEASLDFQSGPSAFSTAEVRFSAKPPNW
jgi:hypothetical protein